MATLDALKNALVEADRAGDTRAAELIADKIKETQATDSAPAAPSYGMPESAAMKFTEGATMGFADEASGGLAAALSYPAAAFSDRIARETEGMGFADRYRMYRDRERDRLANVQQQNPITSTTANIGGTVAGALIPAQRGLTAFKGAQGTKGLMKAGALEGVAYGALGGAGYSEAQSPEELAMDVATGGTIGSVTGGASPLSRSPSLLLARHLRHASALLLIRHLTVLPVQLARLVRHPAMWRGGFRMPGPMPCWLMFLAHLGVTLAGLR